MTSKAPTPPQPLSLHQQFVSEHADEIRERISSHYHDSSIRIGPAQGQNRLAYELYAVPLGGITLTSNCWPMGVDGAAPCLDESFEFCSSCNGEAEITVGKDTNPLSQTTGVVLSPNRSFHVRAGENNVHLNVTIPRRLLEAQLRALTGCEVKDPLEFDSEFKYRREPVASIWRLVQFATREMNRSSSSTLNSLVAERLCETILTGLLCSQPNNYSELLQAGTDRAVPRHVREVEEYLEANCELPISARDLAEVAGVSQSALYAAFRKHREYTPSEFLKMIRLGRVRDSLLSASPGTTVREVAMKFGFSHLGRFSRDYTLRYGESPSETLRRK